VNLAAHPAGGYMAASPREGQEKRMIPVLVPEDGAVGLQFVHPTPTSF
jgi:hypothetical protein